MTSKRGTLRLALNCLRIVLPALGLFSAAPSQAAPIVGGTDVVPSVAVQSIDLFPGTPFNPTANPITLFSTGS